MSRRGAEGTQGGGGDGGGSESAVPRAGSVPRYEYLYDSRKPMPPALLLLETRVGDGMATRMARTRVARMRDFDGVEQRRADERQNKAGSAPWEKQESE